MSEANGTEQLSLFDMEAIPEEKHSNPKRPSPVRRKDYDHFQGQITDSAFPPFVFTKDIRMIELFAGYGSQKLAMEYLDADGALSYKGRKLKCESWRMCEWSPQSTIAYKAIHCPGDNKDYSEGMTKEQIANALFEMGVSYDWNTPCPLALIKAKKEKDLRAGFNAIKATKNLVDVSKAKGADFAMPDRDQYQVIMTYSFPCQDLSLAGGQKGMDEWSGTRSSMLWQVRRILKELAAINQLPDVLLMENVPEFARKKNSKNVEKWEDSLGKLGYKNYIQFMNGIDYGIPQTRNRCFMVSVLGDYSYQFPMPEKPELVLKDFLEEKVDEKYYLKLDQLRKVLAWNGRNPLERPSRPGDKSIGTIIAKPQSCTSRQAKFILEPIDPSKVRVVGTYQPGGEIAGRVVSPNAAAPTVMDQRGEGTAVVEEITAFDAYNHHEYKGGYVGTLRATGESTTHGTLVVEKTGIPIKALNSDGCIIACDGDGIYADRPGEKGKSVQKGAIPSLRCNCGANVAVVEAIDCLGEKVIPIADNTKAGFEMAKAGDGVYINRVSAKRGAIQTIKTSMDIGVVVEDTVFSPSEALMFDENGNIHRYIGDPRTDVFGEGQAADISYPNGYNKGKRVHDASPAITPTTAKNIVVRTYYRIRKLIPLECFRLMGVKDAEAVRVIAVLPESICYHLAGDSIICGPSKSRGCLTQIFRQMLRPEAQG